jgi:hypothetical protein
MMSRIDGLGKFHKCKVGLGCCLVLGPLFWESPDLWALPYTYDILISVDYWQCPCQVFYVDQKVLTTIYFYFVECNFF